MTPIQIIGFILIGLVMLIIVVIPYYCENDPKKKEEARSAMIVFLVMAVFAFGIFMGRLSVLVI